MTDHESTTPGLGVSIVIPALNEAKVLGRCLRSVSELARPETIDAVEVIVVDNESTDETVAIARSLGAQVISCAPGRPSRARNLGAAAASGDWIVFVDADCELAPDWLAENCRLLEDGVVAVGGSLAPPPESTSWVTRAAGRLGSQAADGPASEVRWLPTAGLMVRRLAFQQVGGFDESLTTCEDCDLGYRLAEIGRLLHNPAARVVHLGESTTLGQILRREAWRSRDNLRLAWRRPSDLRNWLSLLAPLVFALCIIVGGVGCLAATALGMAALPSLAVLIAGVAMPLALTLRKGAGASGLPNLARCWMVVATYLLGRAIGLAWAFPRVAR